MDAGVGGTVRDREIGPNETLLLLLFIVYGNISLPMVTMCCIHVHNFGCVPVMKPVRFSAEEVFIRGDFINLSVLLKGILELNDICSYSMLCLNSAGRLET